MIKKLKISLLALVSLSLFAAPLLVPVSAYAAAAAAPADIQSGLCSGASLDASGGTCDVTASDAQSTVTKTLALIINIFSLVVGVAAVIMIIIGGLRYIISGGDSGNVTSAKNTILYAIIGLVVVALSQFIVKFVLTKTSTVTG